MKIESIVSADAAARSMRFFSAGPRVRQEQQFNKGDQKGLNVTAGSEPETSKVSPSEILDKIRELSQDGLYSIRFEKNDKLDEFIVKIVDRETDEVIRQIPPEEILGAKAKLLEYSGNIVRSEG